MRKTEELDEFSVELENVKLQLKAANDRSDRAEAELKKIKEQYELDMKKEGLLKLPPPPPPLPNFLQFSSSMKPSPSSTSLSDGINQTKLQSTENLVKMNKGKYVTVNIKIYLECTYNMMHAEYR